MSIPSSSTEQSEAQVFSEAGIQSWSKTYKTKKDTVSENELITSTVLQMSHLTWQNKIVPVHVMKVRAMPHV